MKNLTRKWIVLNVAVIFLLGLNLTGCSSEDTVGSPGEAAPTTYAETETYRAISGIEGGPELLAKIPDADKKSWPAGTSLILGYYTNTIQPGTEPVEFPLNSSYFHYEGFGFPLGKNTGEGPSIENFATLEQTGSATFTDRRGNQLSCDYQGTFTMDETTGQVDFSGDIVFTGGTGPYSGVTGSGGYVGRADVFAGTGQSVWYGQLILAD